MWKPCVSSPPLREPEDPIGGLMPLRREEDERRRPDVESLRSL